MCRCQAVLKNWKGKRQGGEEGRGGKDKTSKSALCSSKSAFFLYSPRLRKSFIKSQPVSHAKLVDTARACFFLFLFFLGGNIFSSDPLHSPEVAATSTHIPALTATISTLLQQSEPRIAAVANCNTVVRACFICGGSSSQQKQQQQQQQRRKESLNGDLIVARFMESLAGFVSRWGRRCCCVTVRRGSFSLLMMDRKVS